MNDTEEQSTIRAREKQIINKRIEKTKNSMFGFFVNRRKVTLVVVIMLVVWGIFSYASLPREANPEVKIPIAVVTTIWPGASPEDVEDLITNEIENKLKNLKNLKELSSTSNSGISSITVEFEADADLDKSIRKLRDAVDTVTDLPDEILDNPQVTEISINDQAIISFSLVADISEFELKKIAKRIQDEIDGVSGVSQVQIVGDRKQEWQVSLNPGKLKQFNLSGIDVVRAIRSANLNIPLGTITRDEQNFSVRTVGKIDSLEDLGSIVVKPASFAGYGFKQLLSEAILIKDIADVSLQLKKQRTISRLGRSNGSPQNTISLQVFKQTGGNIINIVNNTQSRIQRLQDTGIIPSSVEVVVTNDLSQFIRDDFNTLSRSGFQTLGLIFISLTLVLAFRMAIIAVISIPIIFLMSFGIIDLQGATINSLTLFSLVLALGLLIDTTIVILEGIYDGLRKGLSPHNAALLSIEIYKLPIISGVLTTIAAFVPMFLVSGIVGEFLKTLPLTIAAVLGSSLVVGLLIMPSLSTYLVKKNKHAIKPHKLQKTIHAFALKCYKPLIRSLLINKRKRRKLYAIITILFAVSFGLLASGVIKTELFPESDFNFFIVDIELPQGTILEETEKTVTQVETQIAQIPELENYLTSIGQSFGFGIGATRQSSEHLASIIVNLTESSERKRKSFEITDDLREQVSIIHNARIEVENLQGGPPVSEPIGIQVRGDDLSVLSKTGNTIKQRIRKIEGVFDIDSTDRPSPPQFVFHLDHEVIGSFNLTASQVAQELRIAVFGVDAGTVTVDSEDLDITVRYDEESVISVDDINNTEIQSPSGERIKVSRIADVKVEPALQSIRHRDTKRVVFISAQIKERNLPDIQKEIDQVISEINIPQGYEIIQAGEFEDQNAAFFDLYKAMSVAVFLIFLIIVLQFNSYKQPFVIILTLPLAFIGVIFGTLIFGLPFGFPTFLGVVALAGIVVNDAIVLIDRINYNIRTRKMEINLAVAEAGEARLQPIILTTITTVLGVVPLSFANEFWRGLSIAIGSGIIFATVLTLLIVPLLYRRFEYKTYQRDI